MPWPGIAAYLLALAAAVLCAALARIVRVPAPVVALAAGLLAGSTGFGWITLTELRITLPGVMLHVALLLGVVGYRLGKGMLRLPFLEVARRSLPPLALAGLSLGAAALVLPALLPDVSSGGRPFIRFHLPLALVVAVFALLAVRDLRGRAPADIGHIFLVAVGLVGAVYSFTPQFLWVNAEAGVLWRGPLLVLGESGAAGVATALLWTFLVRRLRVPKWPAALVLCVAVLDATFRLRLWPPFAALGFGIILGRTGEAPWRMPKSGALFSEAPFVLLVAAVFAPDLMTTSMAVPAALNLGALALLLLLVRAKAPGGRDLVTGPGLLFLGLTLTVRLDARMGPITRYAVDFALPAWVGLRLLMAWLTRRARSSTTSTRSSA